MPILANLQQVKNDTPIFIPDKLFNSIIGVYKIFERKRLMDYKKLKSEIKEIAGIANSVPDSLKEKCFEILLNNLLGDQKPVAENRPPKTPGEPTPPTPPSDLPITTQLRVFMTKTKITEEEIKSILMVAEGEVHFIREPAPTKIIKGQKEWALLLALRNCILNNSLLVDPEDVRSVCQDKGFYDTANFAANFKKTNIAKLFKNTMEPQGEPQQLSSDGQEELAKLIRSLGVTNN